MSETLAQELRESVAEVVDKGLQEAFNGHRSSFVVAFQDPTSNEVHWITNTSRPGAIQILEGVADKLKTTIN